MVRSACKPRKFNRTGTTGFKKPLSKTNGLLKHNRMDDSRNYKVSMPKNFRKETAAQMPILAKNPSATAREIKRTPSFNISLAIFFFTASFSLTNAIPSNPTNNPPGEKKQALP
jgi:hypothetical protein